MASASDEHQAPIMPTPDLDPPATLRFPPSRLGALAALALGACGVVDEPPAIAAQAAPLAGPPASPGAPGIGDTLFPDLGNGGYQVEHYHLDLRYATAAPSQALDGTVTILARATQALSQLDLDFAGDSLAAVTVDGRRAAYRRDGDELVITPARALRRGEWFTITVEHFVATPKVADASVLLGAPFFYTVDGSAWAGQPNNAHQIFPSNDHPSNKASFSFRLDVPAGTTAVASGELIEQHMIGGRTISQYLQREPMATELVEVAVGALTVIPRVDHAGVRIRDVVPTRLTAELAPKLALELAQLDWLRDRLGAYPFHSYGSLVADASLGFALETQSLSLYEHGFFLAPETSYGPIMLHELAHQWFGDSVAPARWSDVWQNEGHATWYERTWVNDPDSIELISLAQQLYSLGDLFRKFLGPVAAPTSGEPTALFSPNAYFGGFLVLFALRQQIGDPAFRAVERAWVTRYRGRAASTEDFIALASEVSGQDVSAFLQDWLFGTTTPAMPGHPDWTVIPPDSFPLAGLAAPALLPMLGLPPLVRH